MLTLLYIVVMRIEGTHLRNTIREHRLSMNKMTQEELAGKIGVSRQTIAAIERGTYNPSVVLALKLSKVFSVPVDELFIMRSGH